VSGLSTRCSEDILRSFSAQVVDTGIAALVAPVAEEVEGLAAFVVHYSLLLKFIDFYILDFHVAKI
jgi:hypothetical protein